MEIIILSGGLGTRLKNITQNIPKVMAPIENNKPFLEYILEDMNNQNINRVILATGYKKEYIKNYFGDKYKNIDLNYSEEETPLGTGGAIKKALKLAKNKNVIVMNGDIYIKMNYKDLYKKHLNSKAKVTLSLKEMNNFDRYGSIELKDDIITAFNEKKHIEKGYMSVGCYVINKDVLNDFEDDKNFSIENDFFSKYVNKIVFKPFNYEGVFIDIGLPSDYEKVKSLLVKK